MSDGFQTIANVSQIIGVFIAFIALIIQILSWFNPQAPALDPIFQKLKPYLPYMPYVIVGAIFFSLGSCSATPTARVLTDLQATNVSLNSTVVSYETSIAIAENQLPLFNNTQSTPVTSAESTPADAITPTPLPTLVFGDDFDQGIKPEWSIMSGEFLSVDERLTAVRYEYNNFAGTPGYSARISIGTPDWTNYNISLDVGDIKQDFGGSSYIVIRPRYQDENNHPFFKVSRSNASCGLRKDGKDSYLPELRQDLSKAKVKILTSENKYELYLDNKRVCSYRDNTFGLGGVVIDLVRSGDGSAWIDNFVVTVP